MPGLTLSTLLIALGATLHFAVADRVDGVDLKVVGLILMIVGGVALLASFVHSNPWRSRTRVKEVEDSHGNGYRKVEKVSDGM